MLHRNFAAVQEKKRFRIDSWVKQNRQEGQPV
jgi:hypothetical protein